MSHVPHELAEEFPEAVETLARLKAENAHVARLADEYHAINRQIHRAETDVEPVSDAYAGELRRKRLHLKDEIAGFLTTKA